MGPYDPDCSACRLLERKWTGQIVAVLLSGATRFGGLCEAIPGIGAKVLSRRLGELETAGIVCRVPHSELPRRFEYALTPAGRALEGVIAELDRWSRDVAPQLARMERLTSRRHAAPRATSLGPSRGDHPSRAPWTEQATGLQWRR